jgi:7-cyano-7-deazaguanine tRNA-ribosyltransferase
VDEFEIIAKDLMGRIGKLKTPSGMVETPTIMPVIKPNLLDRCAESTSERPSGTRSTLDRSIDPREMTDAEIVIVNSYMIYRSPVLREEVLRGGIHSFLGWEKPIMTDSGAYQNRSKYDIGINNAEIVQFQEEIGSDIGVPLDIPTPPDAKRERAEVELNETLRRLNEARGGTRPNMMLSGPIQGSTFLDLREKSAKRASEIGFEIYSIGGLVPLLESYRYAEVVDIIMCCKGFLQKNAPVHLFGAGHPMFFALAVALGCDLFDSAAYALYARAGRYLTRDKTYMLRDLRYFPCSCPVCSSYTTDEVKEDVKLLAKHNLNVTFEEMRLVKQSIRDKNLWELLERRCRANPSLLEGLERAVEYADLIERYDPASKRTLFYLSEMSARRPEVIRYSNRLDRFSLSGKVLITTKKSYLGRVHDGFEDIFILKPPFGPYPLELEETYPIGQSEIPDEIDNEAKTVALENALRLITLNENRNTSFVFAYDKDWEHPLIGEIVKHAEVREIYI